MQKREITCIQAPQGNGFSASSVRVVLELARDRFQREQHWSSCFRKQIAREALRWEQNKAGFPVAFNDVTPVVYGGAMVVRTDASTGTALFTRLTVRPAALAEHVLYAWNPRGQKHNVPTVLRKLVSNPNAVQFVARINRLALPAAKALFQRDWQALGATIAEYRTTFFDEWGGGDLIHPETRALAVGLERAFGRDILGWKPPGAGAATSIAVVTTKTNAVAAFIKQAGWRVEPVRLSGGLTCRVGADGVVVLSCPARLDLIGAADLGVGFGADGICVSVAIRPRNRLFIADSHRASPL